MKRVKENTLRLLREAYEDSYFDDAEDDMFRLILEYLEQKEEKECDCDCKEECDMEKVIVIKVDEDGNVIYPKGKKALTNKKDENKS